jgi:hypothetical protein
MSEHKTFSLRVPVETFERIKADALTHADGNVNQYVLSWLPETYDQPATHTENAATQPRRQRR